jgi:hypothetical protein
MPLSGKWKVINGKWMDTDSTSKSSSRVSDVLKYGSLDRRILLKHKQQPQASLSRTNSCENVEEPMSPSLKRTSAVQLSAAEKMVAEVARKKLNGGKTDFNNNVGRTENGAGRTSAASKVCYDSFICLWFPRVYNDILGCLFSYLSKILTLNSFNVSLN